MNEIANVHFSSVHFSLGIILTGIIFTYFWYLDHQTHKEIWKEDISDGELRTHRMILYASWGLQGSLLLMFFSPLLALPLFIGALITRFTHEFIDELKYHADRCDERETLIHLIMWISIYSGTAFMFIWGFFYQYTGLFELPLYHYILHGLIFIAMSIIGHFEINGYDQNKREDSSNYIEEIV